MKQYYFAQGDVIFQSGQYSRNIFILWEGNIQVRVSRSYEGRNQNYWFDNLEKGVCLNVYNSFKQGKLSLLDYYASSGNNIMYLIPIEDLIELGKTNQQIGDRIDIAQLRIQYDLVDDLDYFKFPKRNLECNLVGAGFINSVDIRIKFVSKKKVMIEQMKKFTKRYKKGKLPFPMAIDLIHKLR